MLWPGTKNASPIVCGHRGAPVAVAENTLASFAEAQRRGATWVEFDIRPTADDQLVIHHDPDTSAGVHIAATARADLAPSIPTLAELAADLPELGLDVEIKVSGIDRTITEYVDLIIAELDPLVANTAAPVLVTSFSTEALGQLKTRRPDIATGLLFYRMTPEWAIDTARAAGHDALLPWFPLLSDEFVSAARAEGFGLATWTVNDQVVIERAVELGLDMIIGDDPALIARHRGAEHQ